jgi:putative transposase
MELLYVCNSEQRINFRDIKLKHENIFEFDREETLVAIGAYCLMPNHFHLLLTSDKDNGITQFLGKLSTAYSMYFNKKYDRSGALFQGRFKSELVEEDRYLKYLFSYIHLNPVKLIQPDWKEKGIANHKTTINYLDMYPYSSYLETKNVERPASKILDTSKFPDYTPTVMQAMAEISDWLTSTANIYNETRD